MIGIYKIQNKIDKKLYIGYSSNINLRFNQHRYKLRNNIHENKYLQNAWNKYNEESFIFEIIETCSIENCIEKEDFYVQLFKTCHRKYGYNLAITGVGSIGKMPDEIVKKASQTRKLNAEKRGYWFDKKTIKKQAEGRKGFKHSNDAKIKIGLSSKGRIKTKEITQKTIDKIIVPVEQYTINGEYIKTFNSIKDALISLGKNIKSGHITSCCKNKRKTAYGYKWKYKN